MLFIETPTLYSLALCCSYLQFGRASLPVPQETRNKLFFPETKSLSSLPPPFLFFPFVWKSISHHSNFFFFATGSPFLYFSMWLGLGVGRWQEATRGGAGRGCTQSVHTAQHFLRVCPTPLRSSELTHTFFSPLFSFSQREKMSSSSFCDLYAYACVLLYLKKNTTNHAVGHCFTTLCALDSKAIFLFLHFTVAYNCIILVHHVQCVCFCESFVKIKWPSFRLSPW